jgi:hypothetical protein
VTSGWGTTTQTTNFLGAFNVPFTAWETYNYIPLEDSNGNLITVTFNGSTNTLQLGRPNPASSDCNANFLMLVPIFAVNAALQKTNLIMSFPTQAGFNYQAQYKTNLTDPQWLPIGSNLAGNNLTESMTNPAASQTRFFRMQIH